MTEEEKKELETVYLTDKEGADYVKMSLPTFMNWSKKIGARKQTSEHRYVNVRRIIDEAILNG